MVCANGQASTGKAASVRAHTISRLRGPLAALPVLLPSIHPLLRGPVPLSYALFHAQLFRLSLLFDALPSVKVIADASRRSQK